MHKSLLFIILSLFLASSLQANYDHATTVEMSRASFATYCSKSLLKMTCGANCKGLAGYNFVLQGEYAVASDKGEALSFASFVNTDRKRFVLAFRGTIGDTQLINEVSYSASVPFTMCPAIKNAKAMGYFNDNYVKVLRAKIQAHMRDMIKQYPDFEYFITGHSLGGALANLAALDLSCNGIIRKEKLHLYTYGSPRVGDFNFATAVVNSVSEAWRITHNRDMVVHIPMCKMSIFGDCTHESDFLDSFVGSVNYAWHIWPEVHFSQDFKTYKICTQAEDKACARQYMLYDSNFDDHMNYLGSIQACS